MTDHHDLPDVDLPDVTADFPSLRAPSRSLLRNEYIDVATLSWPSVTNWNEKRWRKAIENGKLPAFKFPNGRVLIKTQDVFDFIMGFANPAPVASRARAMDSDEV